MAALDRLGWVAGVSFDAYGARIGVRVNSLDVLDMLARRLPPGTKRAASRVVDQLFSVWIGEIRGRTRGFHLLYAGSQRQARTLSEDELLETFEAAVRLGVAAAARRRVFVHAGVVGWQGRAILIPGRSGSGKTTLVTELLRAGATYYSDEFALLDERGRVHPFAKPLSIRDGAAIRRPTAEELGAESGSRPLPVGLIAFAAYEPGARWRPAPVSPAHGVLGLVPHTVPVRGRPEASLAALRNAVEGARIVKSRRGEAAPAAAALLRQAEEAARGAA
jgi:hypothetical protein